jgi:hypothetical protein
MTAASGSSTSSRHTSDPFSVGCYHDLDQQADTIILGIKGWGGNRPAEACADEWEAVGHPLTENLVTCVVTGGGLGVFPNEAALSQEDACGSIGASVPAHGRPYGGLSIGEVRSLDRRLAGRYEATWQDGSTCRSAEELRDVAEDVIDDSATQEWTVTDSTSAEGRSCATFRIEALSAEVVLIDV